MSSDVDSLSWQQQTVNMDCSAVRGSGVFTWVSSSETDNTTRQPRLLHWTPRSCFWETLLCPASLNTRARTVGLCGRRTAAFHISHVFHTAGPCFTPQGDGLLQPVMCYSWVKRANCIDWRLIHWDQCDDSLQRKMIEIDHYNAGTVFFR